MGTLLLFQNVGIWEILIIALVILLFFGGKKIPELMKGLGKGVRSFKEGMSEVEEEIKKPVMPEEKGAASDKTAVHHSPEPEDKP